ncbi:HAD-IIA family hydrolase [Nisaea sediminum]|uniref:HAD-IIA family hydrolase n=1 Tax=Nisaea sediminum TaxID=2775867 RepID=UPI001868C015|nr:HAD hydrolase-like protein [Nisaea sediminum]
MPDMERLSFEEAWNGYLKWAHRLPPAPPPVTPRRISGIAEIISDFDAVILDNFGVLSLGPPVIPAGPPAYAAIRDAGAAIRVISNDGSKALSAMLESHRRRGYHFAEEEIYAGLSLLEEAARDAAGGLWAAIGLDPLPVPSGTFQARNWATDRFDLDEAAGLLLMDCLSFGRDDFRRVLESFRRYPRPVIVCNPDLTAPYTDAMSLEPGYLAHWLADEAGIEPLFLGKPFPEVYRRALRDLPHVPPERVLCVGDTLHTDVLGGRHLGMKTLLVETGFTRGQDPLALADESGIWPDFIASSI